MKNFVYIIVASLLLSCSNEKDEPNSFSIVSSIFVYLKDSSGQNLMNTTNYDINNIKVYYKVGNELILQSIADNNGTSNQYSFSTETNPISLKLNLNISENEEFPETVVKWNDTESDTFKVSVKRVPGLIAVEKIWINDVLVSEANIPNGLFYTIVK